MHFILVSSTLRERKTEGFCERFIDPLQLDKSHISPETEHVGQKNGTTSMVENKRAGRIVLIDISLIGDSIDGFLRLIWSCVAKTYNPYTIDENLQLSQPFAFLDMLGVRQKGTKIWD